MDISLTSVLEMDGALANVALNMTSKSQVFGVLVNSSIGVQQIVVDMCDATLPDIWIQRTSSMSTRELEHMLTSDVGVVEPGSNAAVCERYALSESSMSGCAFESTYTRSVNVTAEKPASVRLLSLTVPPNNAADYWPDDWAPGPARSFNFSLIDDEAPPAVDARLQFETSKTFLPFDPTLTAVSQVFTDW